MTVDRYVKGILTVIAVALVVIAAQPWARDLALPRAEAQSAGARYEVSVPKAWGKLVGYSNNNVLLEAADGLRIVDVEGKSPEFPRVKVHIRWN
jgi:hypothetical protein